MGDEEVLASKSSIIRASCSSCIYMSAPLPLCANRDGIIGGVTEMANLTFSFNHMLEDIVNSTIKIAYSASTVLGDHNIWLRHYKLGD